MEMKRFLLICLSAVLVLLSACQTYRSPRLADSGFTFLRAEEADDTASEAETETESPAAIEAGDFLCEPNEEGGLTLTAYRGSSPDPEIPSEINGQPVTAIGDSCFAGLLCLERVRVPEGITRLGNFAFECCGALKKVYLPDSLRTIGDGAFSGCVSLVLLDIQEGLISIGRGAFLICRSLVYLDLPESLTEIGAFACSGCSDLTTVIFHGDDMAEIPDHLFYSCERLSRVTLPKNITSIGAYAFYECENLTYLYAANLLSEISKRAFYECGMLRGIDMSAQAIGDEAFYGCNAMSHINLSGGTESIGFRSFSASGIHDLDLPAGVRELSEGVFAASNIRSVTLEEESHFKLIGTSLYTADGKTLIACFPEDPYAEETEEEIVIPEGVETISAYAFSTVPGASRVVLPESVKSVRAHAFSQSTIVEADIPDSAEVDPAAFLESAMEVYEEEPASQETGDAEAEIPEFIGSIAGERSLFHPEDFEEYLQITNEEFEAWSEKYLDYISQYGLTGEEQMPYIMMYKGETVAHYVPMTYVQNHDPEMYQRAVLKFGDGFEESYQMMNHGLFTELRRGKMCDDLVLYSGVYDSQLMAAAGTDELPAPEQLADAVGNVFTDPCMISTTTDINVACNFSDTLFIIYASREAMEDLGAISIDSFIHTNEKEILMCENAEYRLLDVGTMAVESTDSEGQLLTLYRNYVTVELLGSGE